MAVTSGFFDSYNHDRLYSNADIGSLLDGIITDGILNTYGGHFAVRKGSGLNIIVSSGRGWFKNTWIKNDGDITLTAEPNTADANRTDTVVIDINKNDSVRANTIKLIKGGLSTTEEREAGPIEEGGTSNYGAGELVEVPHPPTLLRASGHWQYALCDVTIGAQSSTITNITDRRGAIYASSPLFAKPYYPVGAIYISGAYDEQTNNPAVLFGGVWKRIAGRFLIGCGTNEYLEGGSGTDSGIVAGISGNLADFNYTIREQNLPAHTHHYSSTTSARATGVGLKRTFDQATPDTVMGWANSVLTDDTEQSNWLPASWDFRCSYSGVPTTDQAPVVANSIYQTNSVGIFDPGHQHTFEGYTGEAGGGEQIEIKPPYIAVHMWIRVS